MSLLDVILTRRTVHAYQPQAALPAGCLERALEAAHAAPNHRLTVPWRFTLPGDQARAELAELNVAIKGARRPLSSTGADKARRKILDATAVVVVSQALPRDPDPELEREDYAAVACAIQNMTLALHAENVGSKWTTGKVTGHPKTYALLGIDPEVERIVGWVWVGLPAAQRPKPSRPKTLADVIRRIP